MSGDVNMAFDYPQPGSSVTISSGPCGNDSLLEFTGSSRGDGHTSFYHPNNTCSETFHSPSNPGSALVSPVEVSHLLLFSTFVLSIVVPLYLLCDPKHLGQIIGAVLYSPTPGSMATLPVLSSSKA